MSLVDWSFWGNATYTSGERIFPNVYRALNRAQVSRQDRLIAALALVILVATFITFGFESKIATLPSAGYFSILIGRGALSPLSAFVLGHLGYRIYAERIRIAQDMQNPEHPYLQALIAKDLIFESENYLKSLYDSLIKIMAHLIANRVPVVNSWRAKYRLVDRRGREKIREFYRYPFAARIIRAATWDKKKIVLTLLIITCLALFILSLPFVKADYSLAWKIVAYISIPLVILLMTSFLILIIQRIYKANRHITEEERKGSLLLRQQIDQFDRSQIEACGKTWRAIHECLALRRSAGLIEIRREESDIHHRLADVEGWRVELIV